MSSFTRQPCLTTREQAVLSLMAQGRQNREIAERLGIASGTVESHVHHILCKLGVSSRLQAVLLATRQDLLAERAAD